jgi:hypothetical protein
MGYDDITGALAFLNILAGACVLDQKFFEHQTASKNF